MHQHLNNLLSSSKRKPVQLSAQQKELLFARVQQRLQIPQQQQRLGVWQRVVQAGRGMKFTLGGLALVATAAVFFITTQKNTPTPTQDNGIQTPMMQTSLSPESLFGAEKEANNALSTNSHSDAQSQQEAITTTLEPRLKTMTFDELLLGRGGATPDWDTPNWTFTVPFELNTAEQRSSALDVDQRSKDDQEHLKQLFGVSAAQLQDHCYDAYAELAQQKKCLTLTSYGVVDFMQRAEVAEESGITEAVAFVAEALGIDSEQIQVRETDRDPQIPNAGLNFPAGTVTEFDLFVPDLMNEELPYRPLPWHATLLDGKLVSLLGVMLPQHDDVLIGAQVISQQEAYDRLLADLQNTKHAEGESPFTQTYFFGTPFVNYFPTEQQAISIQIDAIALEYELIAPLDPQTKEKMMTQLQLVPVYHVTGVELNTQERFDVIVEAAADGQTPFLSDSVQILYTLNQLVL